MVEIKCPYCGNMFNPILNKKFTKNRSTTGNIAKGAIFLPWGVVSALKTKKKMETRCPKCKMIVQSEDL